MEREFEKKEKAVSWQMQDILAQQQGETATAYATTVALFLWAFTVPSPWCVAWFFGGYLVTWLGLCALFAWEETTRHAREK